MSARRLRHIAASVLALCCAQAGAMDLAAIGGTTYRLAVTSMKEARFASTVRQQYDFSCGSAAVATLLSYHFNYKVSEQQVFLEMFAQGDQKKIRSEGFSLLDMKRYLEKRGFKADGFQQPLQKLAEARLPAIVLISENGFNHFVVIKGLQGERILIGDPASGARTLALSAFDELWKTRLLFVVHDRPGKVRFNDVADWRTAPFPPLGEAVARDSLGDITLPKHGRNDF